MAEKKLKITFTYENGVSFQMDSKLNEENAVTILSLEENSCLGKLWDDGIKQAVMTYLEHEVKKIGTEMKAPSP